MPYVSAESRRVRAMKTIKIIAAKEIKEIIRNKYSVIIMLIPLFIYPLLSLGLNSLNDSHSSTAKISVISNNGHINRVLDDYIWQNKNICLFDTKNDEKAIQSDLQSGKIDFLLKVENSSINLIYSSHSYKSLLAATKFGESFSAFYSEIYKTKHSDFFSINMLDETGKTPTASNSISDFIMPVLLISLIFQSTAGFANDMFAGEKERKTLENLLLTVKPRKRLFFGKALALAAVSGISLSINVISFFFSQRFGENATYINGLLRSPHIVLAVLAILLILAALSVTVSLTVSLFSQSLKNSQLLNEFLLAFGIFLSGLVSFGFFPKNVPTKFIPLIGLISALNNIINQSLTVSEFAVSALSTITFIALISLLGIHRLNSEKVII